MLDEPMVREGGAYSTQHDAAGEPVPKEVVHGEENELCYGESGAEACHTPRRGADEQEANLHQGERGVVARPLVLGLLTNFRHLVHLVNSGRFRSQQCHHLVKALLEIHLLPAPNATQVLREPLTLRSHQVAPSEIAAFAPHSHTACSQAKAPAHGVHTVSAAAPAAPAASPCRKHLQHKILFKTKSLGSEISNKIDY